MHWKKGHIMPEKYRMGGIKNDENRRIAAYI
jgi:hypothetical protein